jgi:hypothetical protein
MDHFVGNLLKLYEDSELLLFDLASIFLGNTKNFVSATLSPAQAFRSWLRGIVKKNKGAVRNVRIEIDMY